MMMKVRYWDVPVKNASDSPRKWHHELCMQPLWIEVNFLSDFPTVTLFFACHTTNGRKNERSSVAINKFDREKTPKAIRHLIESQLKIWFIVSKTILARFHKQSICPCSVQWALTRSLFTRVRSPPAHSLTRPIEISLHKNISSASSLSSSSFFLYVSCCASMAFVSRHPDDVCMSTRVCVCVCENMNMFFPYEKGDTTANRFASNVSLLGH